MIITISFFYGDIDIIADEHLSHFKCQKIEQLTDENFYSIFLGKKTFRYKIQDNFARKMIQDVVTFTNVEVRFMLDEKGNRTLRPYYINLYKGKMIDESFLFDVNCG